MKKLLSVILALLYLSTSVGATIELHYCMGRLIEWSLRHEDNSMCSNCGMEKNLELTSGCCKDEYKLVRIDQDQKLSLNYNRLNEAITEIGVIASDYSILPPFASPACFTKINAPPLECSIPLNY